MEDRDPELPVAVLKPRHLGGRLAGLRGALRRWLRGRVARLGKRELAFILTGVVFGGMLLTMGYVADQAGHAADGIDQAVYCSHRDDLDALGLPAAHPAASGPQLEAFAHPLVDAAHDPWATPRPADADADADAAPNLGRVLVYIDAITP
ncbi:MAG: hypothetical protein KC464_02590 [Myxococcales bacterium]|nr:hypothetical protein [Myxococcales bacterium]